MRDKRIEKLLAVGLVAIVLSSVAIYALPNASGADDDTGTDYHPTLPIRVAPPDSAHVLRGIAYWNDFLPDSSPLFVIDREDPQVTYKPDTWTYAIGPYPGTDNHWVIGWRADADSPGRWRVEAHELGHVLGFGHPNNKSACGKGVMGNDCGRYNSDRERDRERLKNRGYL